VQNVGLRDQVIAAQLVAAQEGFFEPAVRRPADGR